jgi:hypothetical protein
MIFARSSMPGASVQMIEGGWKAFYGVPAVFEAGHIPSDVIMTDAAFHAC